MMIECEKVPLLPDPLLHGLQSLAIPQLGSKLLRSIKKYPDAKLLRQCLRSDQCAAVRLLEHRQAGGRKSTYSGRIIQVVPVCPPDLTLVAALEEVQPARIILGKFLGPAALVHVGMQMK